MYQIREIVLQNGQHKKKRLVIEFDDLDMKIVGEFLMADAELLNGEVLHEIDRVLEAEKNQINWTGNRCRLFIQKERTLIEDLFTGLDGMQPYASYNIETSLLRDLIAMWLEKVKQIESK